MNIEKKYPIGGYAPGNYQCKCCTCRETFLGDKRAVQCESCATKEPSGLNTLQVKHYTAISHQWGNLVGLPKAAEVCASITLEYMGKFKDWCAENEQMECTREGRNLSNQELISIYLETLK